MLIVFYVVCFLVISMISYSFYKGMYATVSGNSDNNYNPSTTAKNLFSSGLNAMGETVQRTSSENIKQKKPGDTPDELNEPDNANQKKAEPFINQKKPGDTPNELNKTTNEPDNANQKKAKPFINQNKLPKLPKLPNFPNFPNFPKLPNLPKLPKLPKSILGNKTVNDVTGNDDENKTQQPSIIPNSEVPVSIEFELQNVGELQSKLSEKLNGIIVPTQQSSTISPREDPVSIELELENVGELQSKLSEKLNGIIVPTQQSSTEQSNTEPVPETKQSAGNTLQKQFLIFHEWVNIYGLHTKPYHCNETNDSTKITLNKCRRVFKGIDKNKAVKRINKRLATGGFESLQYEGGKENGTPKEVEIFFDRLYDDYIEYSKYLEENTKTFTTLLSDITMGRKEKHPTYGDKKIFTYKGIHYGEENQKKTNSLINEETEIEDYLKSLAS